jgi:hypothetical protein
MKEYDGIDPRISLYVSFLHGVRRYRICERKKKKIFTKVYSERFRYHVLKIMFFSLSDMHAFNKILCQHLFTLSIYIFWNKDVKKDNFCVVDIGFSPFLAIITVTTSFPSLVFFLFSVL